MLVFEITFEILLLHIDTNPIAYLSENLTFWNHIYCVNHICLDLSVLCLLIYVTSLALLT